MVAFWRCARRRPPRFDEPRSFPPQRLQPVEPVLVQLVFSITRTVQAGENLSSLSSPARPAETTLELKQLKRGCASNWAKNYGK